MKKLLLTGAMFMALSFSAKAQETILSVDFSDTALLEDWFTINADGDAYSWGIQTTAIAASGTNPGSEAYGFSGGFAFSASYNNTAGALTPDNSLISAAFEVPTNGAYSTYKVGGFNDQYFAEHYAVYVISDADFAPIIEGMMDETTTEEEYAALLEDYVALLETAAYEETLSTPMATQRSVDLADYAGENVRLVFRHYNVSDELYLFLDDVAVTSGVMGTNAVLANKFSVSPNPANSVITVANADNALVNAISLTDVNGRVVKSASFTGVASAQVNVSDLANGVYMMNISSDKGSVTKKIVKN